MSAAPLRDETYLPDDSDRTAEVYDFLKAHEEAKGTRPEHRYLLAGPDTGDSVELPKHVYELLLCAVEALKQGHAVTVSVHSPSLTTQQAADLLGVSRPTVVKLLEEKKIPFERPGAHRLIKLTELLAYRERRRAEQYAALEATAVSIDDEDDLATVLEELRNARRAVSARHRRKA